LQPGCLASAAAYCTVPFKKMVCGLLAAPSLTTTLAVSFMPLGAFGLNDGYTMQLAPGPKLEYIGAKQLFGVFGAPFGS